MIAYYGGYVYKKQSNDIIACRIESTLFNHCIYADDVCLLNTSIAALKVLPNICEEYALQDDLNFNPSKSICQCFCDFSFDSRRPFVQFCGKILQWSDTVRYLAYDVDCTNRDQEEMRRRQRELYGVSNFIASRFGNCSTEVKLYLYKTFFSSIYCNSL